MLMDERQHQEQNESSQPRGEERARVDSRESLFRRQLADRLAKFKLEFKSNVLTRSLGDLLRIGPSRKRAASSSCERGADEGATAAAAAASLEPNEKSSACKICAIINDKLAPNKRGRSSGSTAKVSAANKSQLLANLTGGRQSKWLPTSLGSSLQRSLSLQQGRPGQRGCWRQESLGQRAAQMNGTNRLSEARRRLRFPPSSGGKKRDSLASQRQRSQQSEVRFILLNFFLVALLSWQPLVQSAPVAFVDPLARWRQVEPVGLDQTQNSGQPSSGASLEELLLELAAAPSGQPRAEERHSAGRLLAPDSEAGQPEQGRQPGEQGERPADERSLWIERRRLNRDRALEPPAWLREQPMRRAPSDPFGFGPRAELAAPVDGSEPDEPLDAAQTSSSEQTGARRARQLGSQAYEQVLGQMIEEALGGQTLIGGLYDELELRAKGKQQNGAPTQQQMGASEVEDGGDFVAIVKPQGSARLGVVSQKVLAGDEAGQVGYFGSQDQEVSAQQNSGPDSSLLIVGDEVSSEDDAVAPYADLQAPTMGAAASGAQTATDAQRPDSVPVGGESLARQDQVLVAAGDGLAPIAAYVPNLAALDVSSIEERKKQQQQQPVSSSSLAPNSFHVVEDIDRPDGSQGGAQVSIVERAQEAGRQFGGRTQAERQGSEWPAEKRSLVWAAGALPEQGGGWPAELGPAWPRLALVAPRTKQRPRKADLLAPVWAGAQAGAGEQANSLEAASARNNSLAIAIIQSDLLSQDQLIQAATRLKSRIEDSMGLRRSTILGLYPIDGEQLLIKLDSSKLSGYQLLELKQNYGKSARARANRHMEGKALALALTNGFETHTTEQIMRAVSWCSAGPREAHEIRSQSWWPY